MPSGVYPRRLMTLRERFERFAPSSGEGCWEWAGCKMRGGYGGLTVKKPVHRTYQAHRLAYELTFGPIPDGLMVLHRCDNPPCVRPDHLWLGTQADNMQDLWRKGRGEKLKAVLRARNASEKQRAALRERWAKWRSSRTDVLELAS